MLSVPTGLRRASILGIPVDRGSRIEFRMFVRRALAGTVARRIVTLNPEIALAAHRDPRYHIAIRTADCVTVDGMGIAIALRTLGYGPSARITGSDVLADLATCAHEERKTIAFLLRHDSLTAPPLLRDTLARRWPALRSVIGVVDPRQPIDPALVHAIVDAVPEMLIVNFGHLYQEQWLTASLDYFPSVRLAVGVGGAVDYLSGTMPMPPALIRSLGVEWLWRFVREPWRIPRIFRATLVFPCTVLWDEVAQWFRHRASFRTHSA